MKKRDDVIIKKRIIFLTYHFPPDQSAGARRSKLLVQELLKQNKFLKIWVFCSLPYRYGKKSFNKKKEKLTYLSKNKNIHLVRIWIPYLGNNNISNIIEYSFYFVQVFFISIFLKPDITFATSSKLLTGFLGALISKFTNSLLYLDLRDTFVDNYFFLFRYKNKIVLHVFLILIERFVISSSHSINLISEGFKELLFGIDEIAKSKKISLTNFTNGISPLIKNSFSKIKPKLIKNNNQFRVIYAGNIGEGQSIYQLIFNLNRDLKTIKKMKKNNIVFEIYGSGSQVNDLKKLLDINCNILGKVVRYGGLVNKKEINSIYMRADCLMLHLSNVKSIECVIPSKIFEYASTNLPILFGASGYTYKFITDIEGTVPFKQLDSKSFYEGIINSMKLEISKEKRTEFILDYLTSDIYKKYALHILKS